MSVSFPKPLTEEEERYYIDIYENGDDDAKEEAKKILIERNLRLVAHVAKKYTSQFHTMDDFISIGTIGLIKAINTYNSGKATRLATYAARCIENEILMYLRRSSRQKMEVSFDEPLNVDWDGNELLLSDVLGTEENEVYKGLEEEADRNSLFRALDCLNDRERLIINLRYGLESGDGNEHTQKEVADLLGISQSYISRLEKRIMKRLRKEMMIA